MYDNQFCEYASMLLTEAGHMITPNPIYANHSSSETLYIDSKKDVVISSLDRALLSAIDNVSLLLEVEWDGVVEELTEKVQVYSITVDFSDSSRSQNVADIHYLLQQYWSCNHSIIIFKNKDQFVFSFADAARSHILSDWFDISDDCDSVIERLSIANMSLDTCDGYFEDFVYALAREYYNHPISFEEASYGMMPIDLMFPKFASFANYVPEDEVTKEDIKDTIRANLSYYESLYGYDYVAIRYEGIGEATSYRNLTDEIERISFELDFEEEYGEETSEIYDFDDEEDDIEEDDFYDDLDDDFDSAIFDDPVLMVKWLEGKQKDLDEQEDEESRKDTRNRPKVKPSEPKLNTVERREHTSSPSGDNEVILTESNTPSSANETAIKLRDEATRKRLEADSKRREAERLNEEYSKLAQGIADSSNHSPNNAKTTETVWQEVEVLRTEAQAKRLTADNLRSDATQKRQEAERLNEEYSSLLQKNAESSNHSPTDTEPSEEVWKEVESLRTEAQAKRLTADSLRFDATQKRQEAERLSEEYRKLFSIETDRKERERLEAERREQERLELVRKEREKREQERLEVERKEREWLENDIREQELWLNIQKEHKRREAERREQERLEAERRERERLEAERREQERLEAERKERERLEAECREKEKRRQKELDELSQKHSAELSAIKQKYESELSAVTSEIATIKRRLSEIEDRIPKLNFLQFGEKKNLKAEQEQLTERLAKLNSLAQEMKKYFERETNLENHRYDEILREIESRYE